MALDPGRLAEEWDKKPQQPQRSYVPPQRSYVTPQQNYVQPPQNPYQRVQMRDAQLAQQRLSSSYSLSGHRDMIGMPLRPIMAGIQSTPDRITIVNTNRGRKMLIEKERGDRRGIF